MVPLLVKTIQRVNLRLLLMFRSAGQQDSVASMKTNGNHMELGLVNNAGEVTISSQAC